MLVEAKRYGQGDPDPSVTYLCSQFPEVKFENNKFYIIVFEDGQSIRVKCTRARTTLYSGKLPNTVNIKCVERGPNPEKVFHAIRNLVLDESR